MNKKIIIRQMKSNAWYENKTKRKEEKCFVNEKRKRK